MKILIGEITAFLISIALLARVLDWWMTSEGKAQLKTHIENLLSRNYINSSSIVKAPLSAFNQLLNLAIGEVILSKKAFRRSSLLSILLLIACLAVGGVLSNTFFGISDSPWSAYEKKIAYYENIINIEEKSLDAEMSEEESAKVLDYISKAKRRIEVAKKHYLKWIYSIFLIIAVLAVNLIADIASIAFIRKVVKDLLYTESLILISGALLLSVFVSFLIVNFTLITLFTFSSPFFIESSTLGRLIFSYSKPFGIGIAIGYGLYAWWMGSTWLKAAAISAIIPSLMLVCLSLVSATLYPMRSLIGALINKTLTRAVRSEKGVLLFVATGATLLAAVIVIITNFVIDANP